MHKRDVTIISMIYSSRGAEFRMYFGKIGGLRALTDAPLIAVTATAPKAIQAIFVTPLV